MKIVTADEMRAIDRASSERFGVPSLTLMENAGAAVAEHVLAHFGSAQKIVVFCGKGNNGGDGFVAARRLHEEGKTVQVILLADPADLRGDAAVMFGKLPVAATIVASSEEFNSERVRLAAAADLYLDAILGTGFKPPVSGLYAEAIAILECESGPRDCRGYSFRRGRRCDGAAGGHREGNHRTGGCDCDIYRAAAGACVQLAHGRADLRRGYRLAARGDCFFAATRM